jgi:hypothetical protein
MTPVHNHTNRLHSHIYANSGQSLQNKFACGNISSYQVVAIPVIARSCKQHYAVHMLGMATASTIVGQIIKYFT